MKERRILRSSLHSEALELMLDACRRRNVMDALIVSDEQGLLLASSAEDDVDVKAVAAALPGWSHREQDKNLRALSFELERNCLYVGSVGALPELMNTTLSETANSARRILAA